MRLLRNSSFRAIRGANSPLSYDLHKPNGTTAPLNDRLPVFIAHGLFGSARNWQTLGGQIANRLNTNVYCIDLRNHGSSPHTEQMSVALMADDINELATLVLPPNHPFLFCGHSLGGRVGIAGLLQDRMSTCAAAVIVDMAPVQYNHLAPLPDGRAPPGTVLAFSMALDAAVRDPKVLAAATSVPAARRAVDLYLADVVRNPSVRAFLMANLVVEVRDPGHGDRNHASIVAAHGGSPSTASAGSVPAGNGAVHLRWRCNVPVLTRTIPSLLSEPMAGLGGSPATGEVAQTEVPTAFFYGTQSDYVKTAEHFDAISTHFLRKSLLAFDAGHWLHAEKPREFVDAFVHNYESL